MFCHCALIISTYVPTEPRHGSSNCIGCSSLLGGFFVAFDLFVSDKGQKDIVKDLHTVNVQEALLGRHKAKVDCVGRDPDCPGPHDSRLEIRLALVDKGLHGFSFRKVQVTKEHDTKDGVPNSLVNEDLGHDLFSIKKERSLSDTCDDEPEHHTSKDICRRAISYIPWKQPSTAFWHPRLGKSSGR